VLPGSHWEPGSKDDYFFLGFRTGTVSVTVVLGRRFASLGGTKRPVPASRVIFFGMAFTSFLVFAL